MARINPSYQTDARPRIDLNSVRNFERSDKLLGYRIVDNKVMDEHNLPVKLFFFLIAQRRKDDL